MGVRHERTPFCISCNVADLQPLLSSDHLQLPVRLTPGAGWLEELTTHGATDDEMTCADLQNRVNGATRAIEYVDVQT